MVKAFDFEYVVDSREGIDVGRGEDREANG